MRTFHHSSRRAFAAVLGIALLGAGCSATRAYEGPALRPDQVAIISEYPNDMSDVVGAIGTQLSFGTTWHTQIKSVDDGEEISSFNDGTAEVLPGRHSVCVDVVQQGVGGAVYHRGLLAIFEAQAGHIYQLRGHGPSLALPVGFDVWDVERGGPVATSDASAAECVTAKIEWDGRHWTQADWGRTAAGTITSYVPSGQVLSSWLEIVELQYIPARVPMDLDGMMQRKLDELQDSSDDAFQTSLESGPDLRVYTWSAMESGGTPEQGVTCLRNGPHGCHVMVYAVRGVLPAALAVTWAGRFKAAELLAPDF